MNLPHSPELRRANESARNAALDRIRAAVAPTPLKETLARSRAAQAVGELLNSGSIFAEAVTTTAINTYLEALYEE